MMIALGRFGTEIILENMRMRTWTRHAGRADAKEKPDGSPETVGLFFFFCLQAPQAAGSLRFGDG